MNIRHIILLNGPPYCGKDTLARHLWVKRACFRPESFVKPIKAANQAFFGLSPDTVTLYESSKEQKDSPQEELFGKSWRQVNIDFAENFAKNLYGKTFAGRLLVNRLKSMDYKCDIIITDCGFIEEVEPVVEWIGQDNISLIKIYRDGCNFSNDSRNYLDDNIFGIKTYKLTNNSDLNTFKSDGTKLVNKILGKSI